MKLIISKKKILRKSLINQYSNKTKIKKVSNKSQFNKNILYNL